MLHHCYQLSTRLSLLAKSTGPPVTTFTIITGTDFGSIQLCHRGIFKGMLSPVYIVVHLSSDRALNLDDSVSGQGI